MILDLKLNLLPYIPSISVKFIISFVAKFNLLNPLLLLIQILLSLSGNIEFMKLLINPSAVVYEVNFSNTTSNLLNPILVPIHKFPNSSKVIQFILLLINDFLSDESLIYCLIIPFSLLYLITPVSLPLSQIISLSLLSAIIYFILPGFILASLNSLL